MSAYVLGSKDNRVLAINQLINEQPKHDPLYLIVSIALCYLMQLQGESTISLGLGASHWFGFYKYTITVRPDTYQTSAARTVLGEKRDQLIELYPLVIKALKFFPPHKDLNTHQFSERLVSNLKIIFNNCVEGLSAMQMKYKDATKLQLKMNKKIINKALSDKYINIEHKAKAKIIEKDKNYFPNQNINIGIETNGKMATIENYLFHQTKEIWEIKKNTDDQYDSDLINRIATQLTLASDKKSATIAFNAITREIDEIPKKFENMCSGFHELLNRTIELPLPKDLKQPKEK